MRVIHQKGTSGKFLDPLQDATLMLEELKDVGIIFTFVVFAYRKN